MTYRCNSICYRFANCSQKYWNIPICDRIN